MNSKLDLITSLNFDLSNDTAASSKELTSFEDMQSNTKFHRNSLFQINNSTKLYFFLHLKNTLKKNKLKKPRKSNLHLYSKISLVNANRVALII